MREFLDAKDIAWSPSKTTVNVAFVCDMAIDLPDDLAEGREFEDLVSRHIEWFAYQPRLTTEALRASDV